MVGHSNNNENRTTEIETARVLRPLAIVLVTLIVLLVVFGIIANIVIYHVAPHPEHIVARLFYRIDLGLEPSLSAWCSSIGLLSCAACLAIIGVFERQSPFGRHWLFLAALFLLMAIDEAIMLHEMIDRPLKSVVPTGGIFYFAWVIPAILFMLALLVVYARFLLNLDRGIRKRFVLAGVLYVVGAVGMEMIAGLIFDRAGSEEAAVATYSHTFSQAVEEGLEMCGVALFLHTLVSYITRACPRIGLWWRDREVANSVAEAPLQPDAETMEASDLSDA